MNKILIIFASWEERSFLGFKRYLEINAGLRKVYLLVFNQSVHKHKINEYIDNIDKSCNNKNVECEHISIPHINVDKWYQLDSFVKNINYEFNIDIDITTMPRNIIWMLMFFLKQKHENITVIYHKPEDYSNAWLSKDPGVPQLLFKHSGVIEFEKPITLFVLAGYDENRVTQVVNYYEPDNLIIGECNSRQDSANKDGISGYKYGLMDYTLFEINQYDNNWGYKTIKYIIDKYSKESNLIVTSLGPKTGAISVYQCFMENPQIALSYVPCKEFNEHYSVGIGETLIKEISLNKVCKECVI